MSAQLLWYVGDQNPAYADQITVAGVGYDLSAKAAQFKMRGPVDGTSNAAVKVNQPVTSKDASGNFTYAWAASDLDTAGQYIVWVEITSSGKVQTFYEAIIEVRAHSAAHMYVEVEQLKSTLELSTSFADQDIKAAIAAASRGIDGVCRRRFWLDADAAQVRYYTPFSQSILGIDDIVTLTTLQTDPGGDGTYELTWTLNSDMTLGPDNADADGLPWEIVNKHPYGRYVFPTGIPRSVKVTGKFGWPAVPAEVVEATDILAHKLLRRAREAPFGIVSIVGMDASAVMQIARNDPDVMFLLGARLIRGSGPSRAGLA